MPQTVYIDGQNNVRVVDAGPPGPPGFASGGGPSGPTDLIPLPISRNAPWTGWVQFEGFPLATFAGGGYRMALGFASHPIASVALEATGHSPMILGTGEDVNFLSVLLAPNINEFSLEDFEAMYVGATYRLTASIASTGGPAPSERIVGQWPLLAATFAAGNPSSAEIESLVALAARRISMPLAADEVLLGLQIDVFDGDGETFATELQANVAIMQVSAWFGELEDTPSINPSSMHTYLGMQASVAMATRYSAPLFGPKSMVATGNGLLFAETGINELGGLEALALASLTTQYLEGDEQLVLSTQRLQVTNAPTDPNDVARLQDLAGAGGEYTPVPSGVSYLISSSELIDPGDKMFYTINLTDAEAFYFAWGNTEANVVARPIVVVNGPSTGSATVEIQAAEANNQSFTVNAGEIWLIFSRVTRCDPPEGTDLGISSSSWVKIHTAPVVAQIGEIRKSKAQDTQSGTTLLLTAQVLGISAADQVLDVPNPGLGQSATFIVDIYNTSGSTKYVNFVAPGHPNHYPCGSDGVGIADGVTRSFWIVVVGSSSGDPAIDFKEIP